MKETENIEQTVSREKLIEILKEVEKSTFINLVTETKVRMSKTGNDLFDKVFKRSSCRYLIGNDYEKRVNNNYTKEGVESTFQSEASKVGTHVSKCVLFNEKTGSYYLQVERFDNKENSPIVDYFTLENGEEKPIDKSQFEKFLPKIYESQKQEQDKKVMVITPKIENIKKISIDSEKYVVVG
jgi:hypothetical protein